MKDDAEKESGRERERDKKNNGSRSIPSYASGPVADNLGYLNRR